MSDAKATAPRPRLLPAPHPPCADAPTQSRDREADALAVAMLALAAVPFAGLVLLGRWSQVELGFATALAFLGFWLLRARR